MATTYTVQTEGKKIGDFLQYEGPSYYSRKSIEVAATKSTTIGDIAELFTGKVGDLETAANAMGICLESKAAGEMCLVAVRHCIFIDTEVGYNGQTKATVDAALEALGIVPHSGIA